MRTRIAVPVAVFSVSYELRSGRPYSGFERLVLSAVVDGTTRLADLEATFAVHRRVLVESVITLVHAGWIALGSGEADLIATQAGRSAITSDRPPSTVGIRRPQPVRVLMEQACGALVSSVAASYRTLPRREQDGLIVLKRTVHRATLTPGEVQDLLPHSSGEWVSWIDSEITPISSGLHYVIAEIDSDRGVVHNMPQRFLDSVEPLILEHLGADARLRREEVDEPERDGQRHHGSSWFAPVTADDLVVGAQQHVALVEEALDNASSRVLLTSAFLGSRAVGRLAPKITGALLRGVNVDLLWGYESDSPTPDALAQLGTIAETAASLRATGSLRYNERPSGSHMKVLAWDRDGSWQSTVGSFNWLSAHEALEAVDVSVVVRHDGFTAAVLRHVGDVWRAVDGGPDQTQPRIWEAIASQLESEQVAVETPDADSHPISLVYGRSHEIELRNALRYSQHRLVVTSHRLGAVGLARLALGESRERPETFRGIVITDELIDNVELAEARAAASRSGCQLLRRAVHAKVLIHDETVIIGSYNYLSADVAGTGSRARELSVRVEGPALPSALIGRLQGMPKRVVEAVAEQ